jgi:hypothetical protein
MAANTLAIVASDSGNSYPLRGDMAVSLNFVPDADFDIELRTFDTNLFVITSTAGKFQQLDGSLATSLVVGGKTSLWLKLRFNTTDGVWEMYNHNLKTGEVISSGGGGGSGSGSTPEVLLVPDSLGNVTFNAEQGNNFRVVATSNIRFMNPVGYVDGNSDITCVVVQDLVGSRQATWDLNIAMQDGQPGVLATVPGAMNLIRMHATTDPVLGQLWITELTPDKSFTAGYSASSVLALINDTSYFQMGVPVGSPFPGAMPVLTDGQTLEVIRNARGPEATGTNITNKGDHIYIVGRSSGIGTDRRPVLKLLPENRPSYGKALLNFEGKGTAHVSNLRLTGARNTGNDARGICHNADGVNLVASNVEITDCNNGILTGNETMTGNTDIVDMLIDKCGIGGPAPDDPAHGFSTVGYTHSVYFGRNDTTVRLSRMSMTNAIHGDNLKCRSAFLYLNQVLCKNAALGRELEIPNGGWVEATNCIFWKSATSGGTGNTCLVGGNGGADNSNEGLITARTRRYKFTNCRFRCDIPGGGRDMMFICSLDGVIPMEFIDCEFIGDANGVQGTPTSGSDAIYTGCVTKNGIRYKPSAPPIFTFTGGPIGPILPVGYFPVGLANVQS